MSSAQQEFARALERARSGAHADAVAILRGVLATTPAHLAARQLLSRCLLAIGDADAALTAASHPALLDDDAALGALLSDFGAAGALAQRAALLTARAIRQPHDYASALALAAALHQLGNSSEALAWAGRAAVLRPQERMPREIRATCLIDRGDVEAGLAAYRALLAQADDAETAARHLVLMHYDPRQTSEGLFAALREYAQQHLRPFGAPFVMHRRDPEQRLRIGWVSPRFTAGPVASFFGALLGAFDRDGFEHRLISLMPAQDASTDALRSLADGWIDAHGLDDAALLQRLRALELDVVIDLAGHSTWNRIGVLAQRVAPLQLCWLDWFDTTGVAAMDAWISDAWLTPPDSPQRYSEQLVRLPTGRFCYTPPADAPPPQREGDAEGIVFASFNRLAKLNDDVVDAWAAILQRVPAARLELRARPLGEAATRAHVAARFAARGIAGDRFALHGHAPYRELLDAYRRVDIALDPFPFSGCTTTCDALWMGCPVIALAGETFVSRQSASLLWRLGRDAWVADDHAGYVDRAVAAAADIATLRAQRPALREAARRHLCDARAQADDFATLLRALWRTRCAQP